MDIHKLNKLNKLKARCYVASKLGESVEVPEELT